MSEFKKKYIVIKNNRDFSFLFKRGESIVTFAFVCYVRERRGRCNRLGIVTGKKVGNAVKRNRSRRIIREAFRLFEPILKEKTQKRYDFVFVARSKTPELKSTKIYSLMMKNILSRLWICSHLPLPVFLSSGILCRYNFHPVVFQDKSFVDSLTLILPAKKMPAARLSIPVLHQTQDSRHAVLDHHSLFWQQILLFHHFLE